MFRFRTHSHEQDSAKLAVFQERREGHGQGGRRDAAKAAEGTLWGGMRDTMGRQEGQYMQCPLGSSRKREKEQRKHRKTDHHL
eukprot:362753-Chlamydomonas_euryale.AAC.2